MDRFSPIAPAQIRVLVLPVGEIERRRFSAFLQRLQHETAIVRLGEVPGSDAKSLLAPQTFPHGSLFLNFTSSAHNEAHQQLSPYELFREPLIVIGVVEDVGGDPGESGKQLSIAREHLKELHPRVVHRQLLVLQTAADESTSDSADAIYVTNPCEHNDPVLGRSIRQMSARFLQELATYTKAMQASPSIQTPGQTSRSLQRPVSLRSDERGSGSGHNTPTHVDPSSPAGDEHNSRPPSLQLGSLPPATSFDQMQSANPALVSDGKANGKNKAGAKTSGQEPVSVHGFGTGTTAEKARTRGKARVGIVIGHIYMMAGQWNEALRVFVEHTGKARSLSDNLWHAKGLEGLLVCMTLCAWAGLDFTIPTICLPVSERTTAAHVKRLSISLSGESKQQSTEAAFQASVQRLSSSLPDITKLVLSLYRSGEGPLELPALVICEAVVRFSKLLAIASSSKGELSPQALSEIVSKTEFRGLVDASGTNGVKVIAKTSIADMLGQAQPTHEDSISLGDHISILAGVASVYALLRMNRRKAIIIRDILLRLTGALIQARKLGAAEMGIHPAASLSTETGAETILSVVEERGGINDMLSDLAHIYGLELVSDSDQVLDGKGTCTHSSLGGTALKMTIMRELVAFCEASPDPYGVVRLTASLLMSARPISAVDEQAEGGSVVLFKEEQARFATVISRTIGVAKHLGMPEVKGAYWDPFLVRGINFEPPDASRRVAQRPTAGLAGDQAPVNPLLYDPNATRPNIEAQQTVVLVANEVTKCIVTLQNPLDLSVDIDSLTFITEGVELQTKHEPFILGPSRLQQVPISVSADYAGTLKITACRVKIKDCREQVFPIFNRPWSATAPSLVKEHAQEMIMKHMSYASSSAPEPATLSAVVIPEQPILALKSISLLESSIMLLNGELKTFDVVLHNVSDIAVTIFEVAGTPHALRYVGDHTGAPGSPDIKIEPRAARSFTMEVSGKAGVSEVIVSFVYGTTNAIGEVKATSHYVRAIEIPVRMTVNAALRAQHVEISPIELGNAFLLSFDLVNAWLKPISYHCTITTATLESTPATSLPLQTGILSPSSVERVFLRIAHEQLVLRQQPDAGIQQALWDQVRVSWDGDARSGIVDLSGIPLSSGALEILRGPPVQLTLQVPPAAEAPNPKVGSFMTCRVTLRNRRTVRSSPLFIQLRLRPEGADPTGHDDRHVATTPCLSRLLPPLQHDASVDVEFVLCPLIAGRLQVLATCMPAELGLDASGSTVMAGHEVLAEKWQAQGATVITVT